MFFDDVMFFDDEMKNDTKCEECSHNKTCEVKDDFLKYLDGLCENPQLHVYTECRSSGIWYGCMKFSQNVNVDNNRPGTCWGCPVGEPGVRGYIPEPILGCETED